MTKHFEGIINSCHPDYEATSTEVERFRLILSGGDAFINAYLKQFTKKESADDFALRRDITYNPAFALSSLTDIRNSIYQKMIDVSRKDGTPTYQEAVNGEKGGVDTKGSSMNRFMGQDVMLELMGMAKVGVLVDRAVIPEGATHKDTVGKNPYLYIYKRECIRHWYTNNHGILREVLLEDNRPEFYENSQLIKKTNTRFRHMMLTGQGVIVTMIDEKGVVINETLLPLKRIPFVIGGIANSLLRDTAKYQIALLNLASSAVSYTLNSNFIFYTEQTKNSSRNHVKSDDKKVKAGPVGTISGRAYSEGMDRPDFIAPPVAPSEANLKMQNHLKEEIKNLVNLNLSSLGNERGLESGLGYIAQELQRVEQAISSIWLDYEKSKEIITVQYPSNYTLLLDSERLDSTLKLSDIRKTIPSLTFRREITKIMSETALSHKVNVETMDKINKEIDSAVTIITEPDKIQKDFELGLVSGETASIASGYPAGESTKALADKAQRAVETLKAQMAFSKGGKDNNIPNTEARGAGEDPTSTDAKDEKKVTKEIKEIGGSN